MFRSKSRVIAGMATMPTRTKVAPKAIGSLIGQVHKLYLYLDGFEKVPDFAHHPKIKILRSQDYGPLKGAGKFLGYITTSHDECFLVADDDLKYPVNFVARLRFWHKILGPKSMVGVHGSNFHDVVNSYDKDRDVVVTHAKVSYPRTVDVLAMNAALLAGGNSSIDPKKWEYINQSDLNFAFEAITHDLKYYVVPKQKNWIRPLEQLQDDSIYAALLRDDSVQTNRVNELLAMQRA